jgi:GTPase-associated protein 1
MAFQQLYYTSCETGLAGYGGYQFNAVTRGTSSLVMREVEDRSVYEPPRWLQAEPALDEPEAYPIALSYAKSEATDAVIVTHVMFAGTDYSGRPGNYFAHALVTDTPGPDFGPLMPAELWGADFWRSAPIGSTELPELQGPLPRAVVDRAGVQAFLDARGTEKVLPELLTAVWRAMAGDRLVLLASHEANENIWWIAAVSYLLGERLAAEMTFTTYSHRPGYSRHHLIGIESDAVPPDADSSFQLFDLDAGKTPGGAVHPLATLLAGAGVMGAEGLWRQAIAFASGTERGPDDWLGPVAAASGLLRGRLSASQTDAVVRWLPGAADQISLQHASVILGMALEQDAELPDEQLLTLLELARRLRSPAQAERLEELLARRAVANIKRGDPAEPIRLSDQAAQRVQAEISGLLRTAEPSVVLAALDWATTSGAMPSDAELDRYGQTGLGPNSPEPELTRLLRSYPAIKQGFLARLARESPQLAAKTFAGPVGALVTDDDLDGYPGLAEERVLAEVARQQVSPMVGYDRIADIRGGQGPFAADADLLARLWPRGCPPPHIADMLTVMADSDDLKVRDWFVRQIQAAASHGTASEGWLTLARELTRHSLLPLLPDRLAATVQSTAAAEKKRHRVSSAMDRGDLGIFTELYAEYESAGGRARASTARDLAALLARADPLAVALRGCPVAVMEVFCEGLHDWLAPSRKDAMLAARVFTALLDPDLPLELADPLAVAFEQVAEWGRRDLGFMGQILSSKPEIGKQFQAWRESARPGLARKLLGGFSRPAEER